MPRIKAFDGYLVAPDRAGTVVSPAFDSVTPLQRREFSEANPENFINTMRMRNEFPENAQPSYEDLLNNNRSHLRTLLENGAFSPLNTPCMFLYQLGNAGHRQTGIVCEVAVTDYEQGRLRKHEDTRSSREDLLAQYQEVVGASSSPICLTYTHDTNIDNYINELTATDPDLDFQTCDGEAQRIWRISNPATQKTLQQLFDNVSETYLTDGHHRAAAGYRYAQIMRERQNSNTGDEPYNQLLVALFPDNQLNLLPFHRSVRDLNGLTVDQLIASLERNFVVESLTTQNHFLPSAHGEFGMYVHDSWYRLTVKSHTANELDPVASLDVSLLQNLILHPILGIDDPRSDKRLGYIAGVSGDDGLMQTYHEGWPVIFTCFPTSVNQLMDVADAGALMPPKSTYFDPKPRSGIFVRLK